MHTIKLKYQGMHFVYCISDEVLEWIYKDDYNAYVRRCRIVSEYILIKIEARTREVITKYCETEVDDRR